MKRIIIFTICIWNYFLYSQEYDYEYPEMPIPITPPSYNASSLGKYVEIPVDYYTGVPKIEIPIFTISTGDLSLPVNISYHASGHKVNETPSWVGLGWTLNAGGAITRVINGNCDFINKGCPNSVYKGYLSLKTELQEAFCNTEPNFDVSSEILWRKLAIGDWNLEPDIFYFNFANYTGKFAFDPNGYPYLFKKEKMKIEVNWANTPYILGHCDYINQFKITTDDGTVFTFDKIEYQRILTYKQTRRGENLSINIPIDSLDLDEYTNGINNDEPKNTWEIVPRFYLNPKHLNYAQISAWYLSRIESAKGDYINFIYDDERSLDYKNGNFSYFYNRISGEEGVIGVGNYLYNYTKRLSRIEWAEGAIDFIADHDRKDLDKIPGTTEGAKALTAVKIYNYSADQVKQIDFNYSYMKRDPLDNHFLDQRLQLDKVSVSKNGTSVKELYSFEYNGCLSSRRSYNVDYWGYCKFNHAGSFKSKLYKYNSTSSLFPFKYSILDKHGALNPDGQTTDGADRNPDIYDVQKGLLKKIYYPTGGYAEFEYEPHEFHIDGNNYTGGGVRIKTIKSRSDAASYPIIKSYSYNVGNTDISSGKIINVPVMGNKVDAQGADDEIYGDPVRYSNSVTDLSGTKSSFIGYTEVKETFISREQSTDNIGEITRKYTLPASFGVEEEDCIDGDCLYNKTQTGIFIHDENSMTWVSNLYTQDELNVLDIAPNPNYDWNRGLILEELVEDTYGNPLKKVEYKYNELDTWLCGQLDRPIIPAVRVKAHSELWKWLFTYSKYYLTTGWRYLKEKQETTYDPINSDNYLTETTNYYFDNVYHMQMTKMLKTNSDGNEYYTTFEYPADNPTGTSTSSTIFQGLVSKHIHNPVIKSEIFANDVQVGGKIVNYKSVSCPTNSFYAPAFTANYENDGYISDIYFDTYNSYGRLLQYHKKDDIRYTQQWGYNNSFVEATAENAHQSEFKYWSFEHRPESVTTTDQYTGKYAGKILSGNFAAINDFNVNELYSDKYIYSGWFKTSGEAKLIIKDLNDNNPWKSVTISNTNGEWKHYELEFDITNPEFSGCIVIRCEIWNTGTENVLVDDVRFMPKYAKVTTAAYKPLVGITAITDPNENTSYFDYDEFGRLKSIKDHDKNIVESYDYNYYLSDAVNKNYSIHYETATGYEKILSVIGSDCSDENYSYKWIIDSYYEVPTTECSINYDFASTGTYEVKLEIYYKGHLVQTLEETIDIQFDVSISGSNSILECQNKTYTVNVVPAQTCNYVWSWKPIGSGSYQTIGGNTNSIDVGVLSSSGFIIKCVVSNDVESKTKEITVNHRPFDGTINVDRIHHFEWNHNTFNMHADVSLYNTGCSYSTKWTITGPTGFQTQTSYGSSVDLSLSEDDPDGGYSCRYTITKGSETYTKSFPFVHIISK